jgi:hypothetical protein
MTGLAAILQAIFRRPHMPLLARTSCVEKQLLYRTKEAHWGEDIYIILHPVTNCPPLDTAHYETMKLW